MRVYIVPPDALGKVYEGAKLKDVLETYAADHEDVEGGEVVVVDENTQRVAFTAGPQRRVVSITRIGPGSLNGGV